MSTLDALLRQEARNPTPQGDTWDSVVFSVEDLPLDKPPKAEGNDAVIPFLEHAAAGVRPSTRSSNAIRRRRLAAVIADDAHDVVRFINETSGVVSYVEGPREIGPKPLPRPKVAFFPMGRSPLRRGMKGLDVLGLKRALTVAGLHGFERKSGIYGRGTAEAVEVFQRKSKLVVDGQYGPKTHAKLARFFDAYGAFLLAHNRTPGPPPKPDPEPLMVVRRRIVGVLFYGYHHRDQMSYLQTRPMIDMAGPPNVPNRLDCSQYDTWGYKNGGAPDPNRSNYNGLGFTGTIAAHGRVVRTPKIADHLLYGPHPNFSHVTLDVGGGRCLGMGSTPGPLLLVHRYRKDFREYVRTLAS